MSVDGMSIIEIIALIVLFPIGLSKSLFYRFYVFRKFQVKCDDSL